MLLACAGHVLATPVEDFRRQVVPPFRVYAGTQLPRTLASVPPGSFVGSREAALTAQPMHACMFSADIDRVERSVHTGISD